MVEVWGEAWVSVWVLAGPWVTVPVIVLTDTVSMDHANQAVLQRRKNEVWKPILSYLKVFRQEWRRNQRV